MQTGTGYALRNDEDPTASLRFSADGVLGTHERERGNANHGMNQILFLMTVRLGGKPGSLTLVDHRMDLTPTIADPEGDHYQT